MALKIPEAILGIWPPHSPDMNPCDYWLWNRIKCAIKEEYEIWPNTAELMKEAIINIVDQISQEEIDRAIDNFPKRVKKLYEAQGNIFEHLF